jgi:O-antigen ligase
VAAIYAFILLIQNMQSVGRITLFPLLGITYFLLLLLSSWIHSGEYASLSNFLSILRFTVFIIYVDYAIRTDEKIMVNAIFSAFVVLVIWDSVGVLQHPLGLYRTDVVNWGDDYHSTAQWLFGNKNNHSTYYMAALFLAFWKYTLHRTFRMKAFVIALGVLLCVSSIVLMSSTSLVVVFLTSFGILSFFVQEKHMIRNKQLIACKKLYSIMLVANVLIISRVAFFLKPIVEGVFGKNMTFSGRVYVWEKVIEIAKSNWFLGVGNISSDDLRNITGLYACINAHNQLLDSFLRGGVFLLAVIIFAFFILSREIDNIGEPLPRRVVTIIFLALMIKMIFEQVAEGYLAWFFFALIYWYSIRSNDRV